ncbi:MAG: hypothetical protein Q3999_05210 [Buchananella hordeovulneris]|nr:hypothetical protein [Buchananella hordeovulneris]
MCACDCGKPSPAPAPVVAGGVSVEEAEDTLQGAAQLESGERLWPSRGRRVRAAAGFVARSLWKDLAALVTVGLAGAGVWWLREQVFAWGRAHMSGGVAVVGWIAQALLACLGVLIVLVLGVLIFQALGRARSQYRQWRDGEALRLMTGGGAR